MIRKLTMLWIAALSSAIATLLATNHPGFAIKFANYLFYGQAVLILLNIFKYED